MPASSVGPSVCEASRVAYLISVAAAIFPGVGGSADSIGRIDDTDTSETEPPSTGFPASSAWT
jgi:hypothetical protein